jgi:hypothetical protein
MRGDSNTKQRNQKYIAVDFFIQEHLDFHYNMNLEMAEFPKFMSLPFETQLHFSHRNVYKKTGHFPSAEIVLHPIFVYPKLNMDSIETEFVLSIIPCRR